ncbi:MAG: ABC transporter substrate-binding protein [Thermoplasmatales archaeon]|nr:ABC transporter substrate-binding protein [Thermoplasmatales archaeon]
MNTKFIAVLAVVVLVAAGAGAAYFVLDKEEGIVFDDPAVFPMDSLQIFGNANGDWTIDEQDIQYIQDIIDGKKEKTVFADANRDGKIDEKDIDQVNRIITRGGLKHIWLVDGNNTVKKIRTKIDRIGAEYFSNTELMLILGLKDKVYAVDYAPYQCRDAYFGAGAATIKNLGNMSTPNYEELVAMNLDIILTFSYNGADVKQDKMGSKTDVLYLGMYRPDLVNPESSEYFQGILKAGYIFNKVDRAEAYKEWLLQQRTAILEKTGTLQDSEKPKVLMTNFRQTYFQDGTTQDLSVYTSVDPQTQACMLAGGKPIAESILPKETWEGGPNRTVYGTKVGIETVKGAKPDYVFCHLVRHTFGGTTLADTPDHGLTVNDNTSMETAYNTAVANAATLKLDTTITLMAGDFRNGATGGVLHAAYIAKIINPELGTPDPVAMHETYVNDWLGLKDYDFYQKGVFTYPDLRPQ